MIIFQLKPISKKPNSTQLFFEKDNTNYRMWILNYDNKNEYSSKIAAEIITSLRPANQGYIG